MTLSLFVKDPGSALTHFIGMIMAAIAALPLLAVAARHDSYHAVAAFAIFAGSMILLYAASTIYHTFNISEKMNKILRKADHMMIFILIAGSYTPFLLVCMRGTLGWTIFGIIWALALTGTILKLLSSGSGTKVWSISLYLIMGWMIVIASKQLVGALPPIGLKFLVLGGFFYTAGILFYVWKSRKYTHAIWHGFVLTGTIMHFFAVLYSCVLI